MAQCVSVFVHRCEIMCLSFHFFHFPFVYAVAACGVSGLCFCLIVNLPENCLPGKNESNCQERRQDQHTKNDAIDNFIPFGCCCRCYCCCCWGIHYFDLASEHFSNFDRSTVLELEYVQVCLYVMKCVSS